MTSHDYPTPEDPQPTDDSSSPFAPPPPPPSAPGVTDVEDNTEEEAEDVGLATEMVFSGQQRETLWSGSHDEQLNTADASFEAPGTSYDDVDTLEDAENDDVQHTTQLIIGDEQAAERPVPPIQQQPQKTSYNQQSYPPAQAPSPAAQQSVKSTAEQYYAHKTGSSNEPFAITMMIVLGIVALGVFGVLGLLIYRLLAGG